jgi:hypothetical protein
VISIGAKDRCIMQWKHTEDEAEEEADMVDEEESVDFAYVSHRAPERFPSNPLFRRYELLDGEEMDRDPATAAATDEYYGLQLQLEKESTADDLKVMKPWVGEVVAPSSKVPTNTNNVDTALQLEFVHGFSSQSIRENLKYTANGDIAYTAANVSVILNKESRSQKFNAHHTDEIMCMAISPDRRFVATGQAGNKPAIIVFDAETGETVQTLSGFHKRAVSQLEFSSDGKFLASAGNDDNHTVAIYDWMAGVIQASAYGGMRKVLNLSFCPGLKLMQCGLKHVYFWDLEGRNMLFKKAIVGRKGKLQAFLSGCFLNTGGEFGTPSWLPIVGTADGHLYLFDDGELSKSIKAHESFVNTLVACKTGLLVSGAKDGLVKLWRWAEDELENTHTFDVRDLKSERRRAQASAGERRRAQASAGERRRAQEKENGNSTTRLLAKHALSREESAREGERKTRQRVCSPNLPFTLALHLRPSSSA